MIKHLLKFYILILIFSMFIVLISYWTIGQSESVKATQNYCESNLEITGKIIHNGILRNIKTQWDSETGTSDLSLVFISENGVFNLNSNVKKINDK